MMAHHILETMFADTEDPMVLTIADDAHATRFDMIYIDGVLWVQLITPATGHITYLRHSEIAALVGN
jgi:hypothetical protein